MSRGDDVWVGNCVESGCRPSHLESALFGLRAQMSGFLPYPGLLIPPLPAPERYAYDLSHHPIVRPRSTHAARC